jgi:hypothetical protein
MIKVVASAALCHCPNSAKFLNPETAATGVTQKAPTPGMKDKMKRTKPVNPNFLEWCSGNISLHSIAMNHNEMTLAAQLKHR